MAMSDRPEPRTRKCPSCGYRFIPDADDQQFCSSICAGTPSAASLLFAAQQIARRPGPVPRQRPPGGQVPHGGLRVGLVLAEA